MNMINKINIKNFKSIVDLDIDLGRINILIGANGCGKTNILEAIAFVSAANQEKLDNEYLGARLRLTDSAFMLSEFYDNENIEYENMIDIAIDDIPGPNVLCFAHYNLNTNKWDNKNKNVDIDEYLSKLNDGNITKLVEYVKTKVYINPHLASFLIFSPEETNLRKFSDDTMIRPLGRRGEGMFRHLKELLSNGNKEIMEALNAGLSLLDWFKGFEIPKDLFTQENRLNIVDRYLKETKPFFDQHSTNEGFLFLLFYLILFNSPKTPSFFAIDNIETSLNPKLSRRLLQYLAEVAKKTDKQVIITTHSPYVLDGLDLSDDEQRLFVVRRNIDGHTKVSRVPYKENRNLLLSEVWMSGVLGGLPDNF